MSSSSPNVLPYSPSLRFLREEIISNNETFNCCSFSDLLPKSEAPGWHSVPFQFPVSCHSPYNPLYRDNSVYGKGRNMTLAWLEYGTITGSTHIITRVSVPRMRQLYTIVTRVTTNLIKHHYLYLQFGKTALISWNLCPLEERINTNTKLIQSLDHKVSQQLWSILNIPGCSSILTC